MADKSIPDFRYGRAYGETTPEAERFWAKVEKGAGPDDCWRWKASTDKNGYGLFKAVGGRMIRSHRWSYEDAFGETAEPQLHHRQTCPKNCVNPTHVTPTSRADHVQQPGHLAHRQNSKTHCSNGHEFTPENTYVSMWKGKVHGRACRTCHSERTLRAYREKNPPKHPFR